MYSIGDGCLPVLLESFKMAPVHLQLHIDSIVGLKPRPSVFVGSDPELLKSAAHDVPKGSVVGRMLRRLMVKQKTCEEVLGPK